MFLCSTLSIVTVVETLFPLETKSFPLSSHLKKHPDGEIRVNLKVIVTKWFCKPAVISFLFLWPGGLLPAPNSAGSVFTGKGTSHPRSEPKLRSSW